MSAVTKLLLASLGSILEIDEVSAEPMPDGSVKYTIITSGVSEPTCELKTRLMMALRTFPPSRAEVENVELLYRGPITKRYKVVLRVKGFFPKEGLLAWRRARSRT